jgi:drug/metabolite transporter (DMT)-like permease
MSIHATAAQRLRARAPDLVALLVVTVWGASFTFQKIALQEIDWAAFTFVRYLGMIALGWAVLLWRRGAGRPIGVAREDLPRMAATGVLGYSIYIVLSTAGLAHTTAFSTALLVGTSPLFTILLLAVLHAEAVRRAHVAGLAVALVGVLVFLSQKLQAALPAAGAGDVVSLAGALFFAAYSVAQKPLLERYAVSVMMAYTCTLGALPVLALAWPAALGQDWTRVSPAAWASLAWTIVVPVYLAWSLWAWVIARAGVGRTSLFMFLVPVTGGVASRLLVGETFDGLKIAGALLILGGLALARRAQAAPAASHPTRPAGAPGRGTLASADIGAGGALHGAPGTRG